MMSGRSQTNIFDLPGLVRGGDPDTSRFAAERVPTALLFQKILAVMKQEGPRGLTTHEIEDATGVRWGSISPRMVQLEKLGQVVRTAERRIPVSYTRPSIVWKLPRYGLVSADASDPAETGISP